MGAVVKGGLYFSFCLFVALDFIVRKGKAVISAASGHMTHMPFYFKLPATAVATADCVVGFFLFFFNSAM